MRSAAFAPTAGRARVAWRTVHNALADAEHPHPLAPVPALLPARVRRRALAAEERAGIRLSHRLHVVPVRLRAAPVGCVRRRLHRLRDRARLRVRLHQAAPARRPAPQRDHRWLRDRRLRTLGSDGDVRDGGGVHRRHARHRERGRHRRPLPSRGDRQLLCRPLGDGRRARLRTIQAGPRCRCPCSSLSSSRRSTCRSRCSPAGSTPSPAQPGDVLPRGRARVHLRRRGLCGRRLRRRALPRVALRSLGGSAAFGAPRPPAAPSGPTAGPRPQRPRARRRRRNGSRASSVSMYSQGVWSSPPTGPSPSSVGIPWTPSRTRPRRRPRPPRRTRARARRRARPPSPRGRRPPPSVRTAAGRRGPRSASSTSGCMPNASTSASAASSSSCRHARRSAVRKPELGTVFRPSPASSPVTWSVSSGCDVVQRGDAQRLARERHRSVPSVSRRLSRVCRSALGVDRGTSGRLSGKRRPGRSAGRTRGRAPRPCRADARRSAGRRPAIPRRARTRPRSGRSGRDPSASSRAACNATATPPFISATPGP